MNDFAVNLARLLLLALPTLIVYLAGIAACVICSRLAPRASISAFIGFVLLLAARLTREVSACWIVARHAAGEIVDVDHEVRIFGYVEDVIFAIGIAALLVAVYVDRRGRSSTDVALKD